MLKEVIVIKYRWRIDVSVGPPQYAPPHSAVRFRQDILLKSDDRRVMGNEVKKGGSGGKALVDIHLVRGHPSETNAMFN